MKLMTNRKPVPGPRQRAGVALENILVAADFSDGSKTALRYAAQLALAFKAAVTVVNVIEVNDGLLEYAARGFPVLDEQSRENRRRTLQSFALECGATGSWRYLARLGKSVDEIVEAAREVNANVIVIGTRGLTGQSQSHEILQFRLRLLRNR